MKRTLVTGASGFVGANLARRLLRDGNQVHLLLREAHQDWRLEEISADCQFTRADVTDRDAVRCCVAEVKPDWVFHLSAYGAYPSQTGFEQMTATNVLGCANVLDSCIEVGVEAFVQAGSSSEYGHQAHATREDGRIEPNSHYAITKAAATHYCQFTARKLDFHAATARLYSIYGPYEEPARLIPTLLIHCLRGELPPLVSPNTARDFVYVDDAVEALIRIAGGKDVPPGAIYNVASGVQTTLSEAVGAARELLGVASEPAWGGMPPRAWDTSVWVGDPAAIRRDTGWAAETSLHDGLSRTIHWLREHPRWLSFYHQRIFNKTC
jgi:nucleoside-diphosphate-sugar epimerase